MEGQIANRLIATSHDHRRARGGNQFGVSQCAGIVAIQRKLAVLHINRTGKCRAGGATKIERVIGGINIQ
ncbi:Uncharacterised protein [Yersinia aldovae]|uniref:Uncharacterized protein n=1 Tax=Yersinia aldovae TaxID=29483 RepID=A0A0T9UXR2_YERAL|nr:Uncharacterised protein [Yersinia aldovae]